MTARLAGAALFGLLGCLLIGGSAAAQEVATVRISQAYARLPEVVAYLDALDAAGSLVQTLDQVTATLQDRSLELEELVPFEQSGEGVAYLFLVDISKSLREAQFAPIRAAIERWIEGLSGADRAAILSFGDSAQLVQDFTNDQEALRAALAGLGPSDNSTQLHLALRNALEVGRRQDPDLPTRRAIVVLSDGKDEGSGLTEGDVVELLRDDPLPIYAIGYSRLSRADRERYLDVMNRFVQHSGGIFSEGTDDSLDEVYDRIRQAIRRVWVARFTCAECESDNRIYPLGVTAAVGGRVFPATLNVRALAGLAPQTPVEEIPPPPQRWWLLTVAAGIALLGLLGWWWWSRRQGELEEFDDDYLPPEAGELEAGDLLAGEPEAAGLEPEMAGGEPEPVVVAAEVPAQVLKLIVVHGRTRGQSYELELQERCVVGTDPGSDLVLHEEGLEPHHFELYLDAGHVWVRDLTRQRRTSVNGVPIAGPFQLEIGDLILAGRTELRVVFEEP